MNYIFAFAQQGWHKICSFLSAKSVMIQIVKSQVRHEPLFDDKKGGEIWDRTPFMERRRVILSLREKSFFHDKGKRRFD
jgi:hypothetical protein